VYKDFKKPKFECAVAELGSTKGEISLYVNKLQQWMEPDFPSVSMVNVADGCHVRSQPKGCVLIIGAWNYPIQVK
jgi:acyl-CoA reductase-like NAD-dependent aldehyde dehydrogenase